MTAVVLAINRRPGKLWAILQFPLTRIVIAASVLMVIGVVVQSGAEALHVIPQSALGMMVDLVLMAAVLTAYWAYVRVIEQRAITEFGLPHAASEFAVGFVVGVLMFAVTMLLMRSLGVVRFAFDGDWSATGSALLDALAAGILEETMVRGVLFRIIEESLGSWIALAISAVVFGALHAFNPGATIVSSVAIALEAGVLLAAVFMYTRRLWMAIGLHAAWNFTEGGIFGASVSGHSGHGLLTSYFQGAAWLTGGKFGPEASLVAVLVCLAAGCVFLWLAWTRNHFVRPVWRRVVQAI